MKRGIGIFAQGIQALRTEVDQGEQRGIARADEDAGRVLDKYASPTFELF